MATIFDGHRVTVIDEACSAGIEYIRVPEGDPLILLTPEKVVQGGMGGSGTASVSRNVRRTVTRSIALGTMVRGIPRSYS